MKKFDVFLMCIWYLAILFIGFSSHGLYDEWNNERTLNGLYIYNSDNISETKEYANSRDSRGDWVCINVAYDMEPELAYTTCVHECSHKAYTEIYAERCESDPIKCMEALNEK